MLSMSECKKQMMSHDAIYTTFLQCSEDLLQARKIEPGNIQLYDTGEWIQSWRSKLDHQPGSTGDINQIVNLVCASFSMIASIAKSHRLYSGAELRVLCNRNVMQLVGKCVTANIRVG